MEMLTAGAKTTTDYREQLDGNKEIGSGQKLNSLKSCDGFQGLRTLPPWVLREGIHPIPGPIRYL